MGVLSHYQDTITLVNRTKGAGEMERNLNVRYDGEEITLKPGDNPGIPRVVKLYAIKQNPLMGSMHPFSHTKFISMVGVKEDAKKYPITPLSEEVLRKADAEYEVIDRRGEIWEEPMAPVKLKRSKKKYNSFEARAGAGSFEGPQGGQLD